MYFCTTQNTPKNQSIRLCMFCLFVNLIMFSLAKLRTINYQILHFIKVEQLKNENRKFKIQNSLRKLVWEFFATIAPKFK